MTAPCDKRSETLRSDLPIRVPQSSAAFHKVLRRPTCKHARNKIKAFVVRAAKQSGRMIAGPEPRGRHCQVPPRLPRKSPSVACHASAACRLRFILGKTRIWGSKDIHRQGAPRAFRHTPLCGEYQQGNGKPRNSRQRQQTHP